MKLVHQVNKALTIAELTIATGIFAAASIVIYHLLYNSTMLAAWNTAANVAHEQARTAMLQMVQDMHSAVSLTQLISGVDATTHDPVPTPTPSPGASPSLSPAPGVTFQLWSGGPFMIAANAAGGQNVVQIAIPAGIQAPVQPATPRQSPYQRLVVRSHGIEEDIVGVSPANIGTAGGTVSLTLANNLPQSPAPGQPAIDVTSAGGNDIICFITDRCSYLVAQDPPNQTQTPKTYAIKYYGPRLGKPFAVMGSSITNPTPFSTRNSEFGTPFFDFVCAFDLSTAYGIGTTTRNSRSANILLRDEVPLRARLTDKQ